MKHYSVNGVQQSTIELTDRGLAYGDGIFTTAKVVDGQVVLLAQHINRLLKGCEQLHIEPPEYQTLLELFINSANNFSLAVLKVMITAGSGGRGYSRKGLDINATNIIIIVSDFPGQYENTSNIGINVGISNHSIGVNPMLAGIKHLNRLEQVLLRAELDERNEDDVIVTNCQGMVIEATSSNLFYWDQGLLCTPDLSMSGVNGIIRQEILTRYPETKICETQLSDLESVTGMFICNSLMGIMPVKTYNNRKLAIEQTLHLQRTMKGFI